MNGEFGNVLKGSREIVRYDPSIYVETLSKCKRSQD